MEFGSAAQMTLRGAWLSPSTTRLELDPLSLLGISAGESMVRLSRFACVHSAAAETRPAGPKFWHQAPENRLRKSGAYEDDPEKAAAECRN